MEVTKTDLIRMENIIRALKRGKFELEGEEILAFAQSLAWSGDLVVRIRAALNEPNVSEPTVIKSAMPILPDVTSNPKASEFEKSKTVKRGRGKR